MKTTLKTYNLGHVSCVLSRFVNVPTYYFWMWVISFLRVILNILFENFFKNPYFPGLQMEFPSYVPCIANQKWLPDKSWSWKIHLKHLVAQVFTNLPITGWCTTWFWSIGYHLQLQTVQSLRTKSSSRDLVQQVKKSHAATNPSYMFSVLPTFAFNAEFKI